MPGEPVPPWAQATSAAVALPEIIGKAEVIREAEQRVVGWSRSAEFSVPALLELRRVRHWASAL